MASGKKFQVGRGFDDIVGGKIERGQGLGALLGEVNTGGSSSINEIEISKIQPNPDQPRSIFDEETLEELATSIRHLGIIQPITIREVDPDKYVIISGERRYRASLKAGLKTIPAYVKTVKDKDVVAMALIENIQREDLNAIEIALAYKKLIEENEITQEQLSEHVGKKRSTIANYIRLLELPAGIQMSLKNRKLDMGHARALLPVEDTEVQLAIYEQIINEGLSVRAVEQVVNAYKSGENVTSSPSGEKDETSQKLYSPKLPEEYKMLKDHLSRFFNTKVQLTYGEKGKGKISIPFSSEEELEHVISLFDKLMR